MRIEWRDKALEELQSIYDYIYLRSPQNAENVVNSLLELSETLGYMPEKFPKEPFYNQNNTRFITKWSFKLVYRIETERIIILRVFSTHQNPDKILE
jgi:toxin ParE1/3/4